MRIERHIFGSYSGYATVARSSGVTADDARTLESGAYGFGQSNDRGFLKSLARQPAYFTRLIGGGRRGLTRVLEGAPDDNNRTTLRLITLIVSQRDWDSILCGDVEPLLGDKGLWEWDGSAVLPPLDFSPAAPSPSVPRKSIEKILALISETERAVVARRPLLVSAEDFSMAEMRALEMLIPTTTRRQFTSACRGLSVQLTVSVNLLAGEASSQGRAAFRYAEGVVQLSPYGKWLAATELSAGTIPLEAIAGYRNFGTTESAATAGVVQTAQRVVPDSSAPRRRKGSPWALVAVMLLGLGLSAGTFYFGKSIGASETAVLEQRKRDEQRRDHEADLTKAVAEQAASDRESLKKATDVSGNTYAELLTGTASKLQDLKNAATTAARDSAAERDRYRSAYEAEMARQRARFWALRDEAAAALAVKDIRKTSEAGQALVRIDGELKSLADEWPAANAEDRKWLAELGATRERVREAATAASVLSRISMLLDQCEDIMGASAGAAADNVQANVEEVIDLATHLSIKAGAEGRDVNSLKAASMARAQKVRGWLADQRKIAATPAHVDTPAEAAMHSWWRGLKPEQREKIRKAYEEKAGGGKRDSNSSTPPPNRPQQDYPPVEPPRSNNR